MGSYGTRRGLRPRDCWTRALSPLGKNKRSGDWPACVPVTDWGWGVSEEAWGLSRRCQWDGPWIALQRRLPNVPGLFPAFAETLLVSSQPLQTGGLHWGICWVDGRPVSERIGLERGAAEAGPLAPRPGPRSGGNEPIAVLPDFVSLPVSGTLGFPPFHGQLHSWHEGVKSTCTLQPMAMRSAFAASPDWRIHRVGGRRADAPSAQGCV